MKYFVEFFTQDIRSALNHQIWIYFVDDFIYICCGRMERYRAGSRMWHRERI